MLLLFSCTSLCFCSYSARTFILNTLDGLIPTATSPWYLVLMSRERTPTGSGDVPGKLNRLAVNGPSSW
jgi:hypothetical protein